MCYKALHNNTIFSGEHEVLFVPKLGSTEELAKTLIKNIINNTSDSNSKIHETLIKKEEEAKKYAE